jgi:hypothetical protein
MKSLNEIMQELGFNKDAPMSAQKAFIKNLVQSANASMPRPEAEVVTPKRGRQEKNLDQLEFDLSKIDRVS